MRIAEQIALVAGRQGTSLTDQLRGVQETLDAGGAQGACGLLGAYRKHLRARSGRRLATGLAGASLRNGTGIGSAMGAGSDRRTAGQPVAPRPPPGYGKLPR
jgi:hypothetical protein